MRHVRRQPGALGVILGSLLALVGALLVGVGPASAAVAAPTELTPNGSVLQGSPVLSWKHVTGATTYNVELSRSHLFDSVIYTTTTSNRHATPAATLPSGELYWRVRSVTSTGTSAWASAMFENGERPGPSRTTWDGQTLPQPDSPPILSWQAVPGATGYEVEVDGTNSGFITASRYTTQTTSLVVPDPQENGVYDWRVRALLGSGVNTAWSAPDTYVIGALPIVDGVVTPVNSPDTDVADVVFDWEPVPGAVTYELQVDDDDSFSAPIDNVVVKGTRYSRPQTYNNNQYWWRVRARNIFGNAQEWTEVPVRQFRRSWPDAPALVYPNADATIGDDFYYQWEPVPLASRYRLEVGQDPNFSPGFFKSCYTTETTYTPGFTDHRGLGRYIAGDLCMPHEPGQTYYWRVQALDGSDKPGEVNGIYSAISSFRYDPSMVQTLAPRGGVMVDVPTLRWNAFPDAVEYDVTLSWNGGSRSDTTASYSWTPINIKLDPARGPFEWTVRAVDANGDRTAAPIVGDRFSLSGSLPVTAASPLTPLSPSAGSTTTARFPTLRWEPLAEADHYKIHIATSASTTFLTLPGKYYYNEGSDTTTDYLRPGAYKWFVTAHTSGGATLDSGELGAFEVGDLGQVNGQRIALHGTGLDSGASCDYSLASPIDEERICTAMRGTPVLDWDPVPDAGYYMVYVSRDREFTNMVYGSKSVLGDIPTTQNTRWAPLWSIPDSQAGDAYYWYIRPCKADGACAPDPTTAGHAFDKRSNQVLQRIPAPAATVANDVTFTWDDYLSTNQDSAYIDPNTSEHSPQAARSYHLQVGTSPAFTTIVDDVTVDQTTYTAFNKTYPEGTLYWRVQPVDGAGNKLTWGPAMEFTKASPAVILDGPASGVAAPTQPLRWKPTDFAASYDIEVYKNADKTASSANRVLSTNSKQVAYSFTKPLAASTLDYVWRVRSVDTDRRKGSWSAWGAFRVGGAAPVVSGPAEGATIGARDALFQWDPLASATSYKFERRNDGSTSAAETIVTSNTAYAPTRTILSGSWRVTARDASGGTLGVSPWRSYNVSTPPAPDTTAPRVIKRSPVTVAKVRANFVAVFNERVYNVSGRTMKLFMKGSTKPVAARVTLSADRKTAKLNPVRNLRRGRVYILRLNSGIKDRAGNRLQGVVWRARAK